MSLNDVYHGGTSLFIIKVLGLRQTTDTQNRIQQGFI